MHASGDGGPKSLKKPLAVTGKVWTSNSRQEDQIEGRFVGQNVCGQTLSQEVSSKGSLQRNDQKEGD